jgi:hypothetical protein
MNQRIFFVVGMLLAAGCASESNPAGHDGTTGSGGLASTTDAGAGGAAAGGGTSDGGAGAGGAKPAAQIPVEIDNPGAAAASDAPVTFGQVFVDGDVPKGDTLVATAGGAPVPAQIDPKAYYPDGSLRHAVITLRPGSIAAGSSQAITLSAAAPGGAGAAIQLDDLLGSAFDASVSVQIGGATYSADARDLLAAAKSAQSCAPWGKDCKEWLAGPEVSSWVVSAPLRDSNGVAHPFLSAVFEIRAYGPNPVTRVRADVAIESSWTYVPGPQNLTYDASIAIAGQSAFTTTGLTHYTHARWHEVFWWGGDPGLYAKLDSAYLQKTPAVPRYQADIHPSEKLLNDARQTIEPMQNGDNTKSMGNTGAQPTIGPLPRWTSAYVVSTDPRAYHWMLANDAALASYGVHYRDESTGAPVSLVDHPCATLIPAANYKKCPVAPFADDRLPTCGGTCSSPLVAEEAHHPSAAYVSYLVTGDFYYLEEMEFWSNWIILWENPGYRNFTDGLIKSYQVRGQAWALRSLGYTAFILPDDAPMKGYFTNVVQKNIDWYLEHYVTNPDANELGAIMNGYALAYPSHDGKTQYVGLAPWQQDFFTWSIANLADLGFQGAPDLLKYFAKFQIGLLADPGYCWVLGAAYELQVEDTSAGEGTPSDTVYSSWAKVYEVNFPGLQGITCASQEMATQLSDANYTYKPAEMTGYPYSPTGFPANLQIGVAGAAQSGLPAALDAWNTFAGRTTKPDYSDYPNFGVVPRNVP